jgi:hypothetical protein
MRGHKTLVYCDNYGTEWSWWCLGCPDTGPHTESREYAKRTANTHAAQDVQLAGVAS